MWLIGNIKSKCVQEVKLIGKQIYNVEVHVAVSNHSYGSPSKLICALCHSSHSFLNYSDKASSHFLLFAKCSINTNKSISLASINQIHFHVAMLGICPRIAAYLLHVQRPWDISRIQEAYVRGSFPQTVELADIKHWKGEIACILCCFSKQQVCGVL